MNQTEEYELDTVDQENKTLSLKRVTLEEWTFEEASKALSQILKGRFELNQKLNNLKDWVAHKGWEKEIESVENQLDSFNKREETLKEALKTFNEERKEKGFKSIRKKKRDLHYDRATGDSKVALRSRILNEVRDELKIEDIADPVIQELRKEFEEVK